MTYLKWFLINSLLITCFMLATLGHMQGFINVTYVAVGFFFFFSLFFPTKEVVEVIKKKGKSYINTMIPANSVVDWFVVILFAYHGFIWCAIAWLVHWVFQTAAYQKAKEGL